MSFFKKQTKPKQSHKTKEQNHQTNSKPKTEQKNPTLANENLGLKT